MRKLISFVIVLVMICLSIPVFAYDSDNYIYQWNDNTGAYLYIDGYGNEPARIDFFFRFDDLNEGRIYNFLDGSLVIDGKYGKLGVDSAALDVRIPLLCWNHVVFDGLSGDHTDIYFNSVY